MRFDRRMMCRSTTHILCVGTIVKPSSTTLITLQANLNSRYFFLLSFFFFYSSWSLVKKLIILQRLSKLEKAQNSADENLRQNRFQEALQVLLTRGIE